MTLRYSEMNQHDALYTAARNYPGGVEGLAQRMKMNAEVLRKKLQPAVRSHHINLEEFSMIIEYLEEARVDDYSAPLHALNWRLRHVCLRLPDAGDCTDEELTAILCRTVKEFGDVAAGIGAAMEDGAITLREFDILEKNFEEATAAMMELRDRVRIRSKAER